MRQDTEVLPTIGIESVWGARGFSHCLLQSWRLLRGHAIPFMQEPVDVAAPDSNVPGERSERRMPMGQESNPFEIGFFAFILR
jgi:hypothetical protein